MNNYSLNQIFIQNKKPRQLVFKKKIKLPHRGGWSGVRLQHFVFSWNSIKILECFVTMNFLQIFYYKKFDKILF